MTDHPRMDPAVKAKWLVALGPDGGFTQTTSTLKGTRAVFVPNEEGQPQWVEKEGHCCLGVLCEIAILEGVIKKMPKTPDLLKATNVGSYLPAKVAKWAGLRDVSRQAEHLPEDAAQVILAGINDNSNDFDATSKWIEENL